ncbi:MAG: ferrous iron transporter B [Kiritimatiellia bacterium]
MSVSIALAGNPNTGKTTLFNALTGSNQYVGNWPGVTVEKKEGRLAGHRDVVIQDLPGIYSLSPYSLEEKISRQHLVENRPDAILNIVDGTNLARNLYLTTQLAELGLPMLVAVNMMDIVDGQGDKIDFSVIGKALHCQVVGISAQKGTGCTEAAGALVEKIASHGVPEVPHVFTGSVEHALAHIEESIQKLVPKHAIRWYAIKIFERDRDVIRRLDIGVGDLKHIEGHIRDCEQELGDDAESIITNQRYEFIQKLVDKALSKNLKRRGLASVSDKIDRLVTHRLLALPIFLVSLCVMWFLAVAENGPGTVLTDWANDGLLGSEGWHLPFTAREVDGKDYETACEDYAKAEATVAAWEAGEKTAGIEDEETGETAEEWTVDETVYAQAKAVKEPDPSDYGVWVPGVGALISAGLDRLGVSETVKSLVVDGAWSGVATVLGFVPVITIVFLFLAFLEGCGYMARVAFIMDRLFRQFGLSGKSFIPMLVGKGCGVPAVMAARAIESERDRRMTVILATFIPCSAKTVIIAMFSAVFFREMWYVAPMMDVLGIAIVILGGIALKKSRFFAGEAAPFIMELPAYHLPTCRAIVIHTWHRVRGYVLKAGLIIFPACVFLWFVMHFDWSLNLLADEEIDKSILRTIGEGIAWLFAPLGFGTWQGAAATVSAEIAKEQATATLGLVSVGMGEGTTAANVSSLFASFGAHPTLIALSFMVFNLFVPPCVVAIAATFREMGQAKWGWFAVAFQLFVGYALALTVYRLGLLVAAGEFGFWTLVALLVDAFILWAVLRRAPQPAPRGA